MRTLLSTIFLSVGLFGLTACGPPPKAPAVEAFEALARALRQGAAPAVWAQLTPRSQDALRSWLGLKRGAEVDEVFARLGVRPDWRFEGERSDQAQLDGCETVDGDHVCYVEGVVGGRSRRLRVIELSGVWRVDLFVSPPPLRGTGTSG